MELAIYAVLAAYIFSRLYSSLGKGGGAGVVGNRADLRGDPKTVVGEFTEVTQDDELEKKLYNDLPEDEAEKVRKIIAMVKDSYPKFSLTEFIESVEYVFFMVVKAFGEKDINVINELADKEVADGLAKNMANVVTDGGRTVVKIRTATILEVSMVKKNVFIAVRFISEQMKNKVTDDDKLENMTAVAGSMNVTIKEDTWLFRRELNSVSPKWYIASTAYKVSK